MSLVVFPFKTEDPEQVAANLDTAASHPAIEEVWAIAGDESAAAAVRAPADDIVSARAIPVRVIVQERIGGLRSGKGDGINTALALAAEQGRDRVHFYDADITNFDTSWIEGAEKAADRGYGVVRHRFPRAPTDGMITWMVTRPALARLFPGTLLPRIDQPLGGEVLLDGRGLESLAGSTLVSGRSDWGIDTVLTYASALLDIGLYEHYVADGKRHALYGSLDELREMLVECLDAAVSLAGRPPPSPEARHEAEPAALVPEDLKMTLAYDVDATTPLLDSTWSPEEMRLASFLPGGVGSRLVETPAEAVSSMDADLWFEVHGFLLDGFTLGDPDWESLAFRLWLARVLNYTGGPARDGYEQAMAHLESTTAEYESRAFASGPVPR